MYSLRLAHVLLTVALAKSSAAGAETTPVVSGPGDSSCAFGLTTLSGYGIKVPRPHYRPSRNHKALWTFPFKNQNLRVVGTSRTSTNCEIRASHSCLVLLAFVERQKPERAGPFDCTRRSPPEKNRSDREAVRFESAAVSRVAVGHDHQQQSFAKFGGRPGDGFVPRLDSGTRTSKRSSRIGLDRSADAGLRGPPRKHEAGTS